MIVDVSNIGEVLDFLKCAYPSRSAAFWEQGIERLMSSPAHADEGAPLGYMLELQGRVIGVGLTAETPSWFSALNCGEGVRRINLGSWYVLPEHRWRMQVLLRRMMRDNNATYTDLTPIEKVQPLLGCLGFLPINNGVAIHNLSVLSLQPCKGARVTAYSAPEHHSTHRRAVADHEGYGCLAFQIEGSAGISPIILKPRCIRSVPVVDVIFSEDNDNLRNALPSLARKLLKLGYLGLILDIPVGTTPKTNASQLILTRSRRRFVKNGRRTIGSDYTYSEVVYFDL